LINKMEYLKLLFLLLLHFIQGSIALQINAIAYSTDEKSYIFNSYVNEFNEYSKKNNLNIKLNLNLVTNSLISSEEINNILESLLKEKSTQYDIYFYDITLSKNYSPYLLDLKPLLPKENIDLYDESLISQISYYDKKLTGLPISLSYNALFSNKDLLNKYKKRIPRTWKELIDTSKYIIEKEKQLNNTQLIAYNGLFSDPDQSTCSIYEFLYSCRESYNSTFPLLDSPASVVAVTLLKKIKDEISIGNEFLYDENYTLSKLSDGNALFLKYNVNASEKIKNNSPYILGNIPGIKDGLSGTIVTGYNVGIIKSIDSDKINYAVEVIKFITSLEVQKKMVLNNIIVSGITSIYLDEKVCSSIPNCDIYLDVQPILKPVNKAQDYNEYTENFTNYFNKFFYGNETAEKVLKSMKNLTQVYKISLNSKETLLGIVLLFTYLAIIAIELLSLITPTILQRFKKRFRYLTRLSKLSVFLFFVGNLMISSVILTKFEDITILKCHLQTLLFSLGYTFIYVPILIKLMIYLHKENKYSEWLNKNKNLCFLLTLTLDILLNGLALIKPYDIEDVLITDGENYQICKKNNPFVYIAVISEIFIKLLIAICSLLLIHKEWNKKEKHYDIKFIAISIYINIFVFITLFVCSFIKMSSYITYYVLQICLIFIISISNYITNYGIILVIKPIKNNLIMQKQQQQHVNKLEIKKTVCANES